MGYDGERGIVTGAIARVVGGAPAPDGFAATFVDAALDRWRMRRTPPDHALLVSKLRRFLPAGPIDASLRIGVGLA